MYKIKKYKPSEVDTLKELELDIFGDVASKKYENWSGWLAWDNGVAVGYLMYTPIDANNWFIEALGVIQSQRGRGIGTELMERCITASGPPIRLHLYIRRDKQHLFDFYSRFNFIKKYNQPRAESLILVRKPKN